MTQPLLPIRPSYLTAPLPDPQALRASHDAIQPNPRLLEARKTSITTAQCDPQYSNLLPY
jgi:hypothetical protein